MNTDELYLKYASEGKIIIKDTNTYDIARSWVWTIGIMLLYIVIPLAILLGMNKMEESWVFLIIFYSLMLIALIVRFILMKRNKNTIAGIITMIFLSVPGGFCTVKIPNNKYNIKRIKDKELAKEEILSMNKKYEGNDELIEKGIDTVLDLVCPFDLAISKNEEIKKEAQDVLDYLYEENLIHQKKYKQYVSKLHMKSIIE